MANEMNNHQMQLDQVKAALLAEPKNDDLLKLKLDLEEIIELTRDLIKTECKSQEKSSTYVEVASSSSSASGGTAYSNEIAAKKPEVENLVKPDKIWKINEKCRAKWSVDGKYYEATIERISDFGEVSIIFDTFQNRLTTTLKELRESSIHNEVFTSNKRPRPNQNDYFKSRKLKKQDRLKEKEEEHESLKNSWLNFTKKNAKKPNINKKSIFATPDNVSGRVGVGTCGVSGKGLTEFSARQKYNKKQN